MRAPTIALTFLATILGSGAARAGDALATHGYGLQTIEPATWDRGGEGGDADERPRHSVTITQPFSLGATEVTQGLYEAVMGSNPAASRSRSWNGSTRGGTCAAHGVGPDLPVTCVTWGEALEFCNRLSKAEGLAPAYRQDAAGSWSWAREADGYRLPTEAEWELAARDRRMRAADCSVANVANPSSKAHADGLAMVPRVGAWFDCDDGSPGLARVASREAGANSLYDMLGNLWEWVWDGYGPYPAGAVSDPAGGTPGTEGDRVLRGGSWANPPSDIRVANRFKGPPDGRSYLVGFRIARNATSPATGSEVADPLAAPLGAALASRVRAARRTFDAAKTDRDLATAYAEALDVSSAVSGHLDAAYWRLSEDEGREPDPHTEWAAVSGTVPGMIVGYGAEGMGVSTHLEVAPWTKRAASTAGRADDAFFVLMNHVYGAADRSWAVWEIRNWDYGGCSGLGSGAVVESLLLVDKALAEGDAFGERVKEVRASALRVVMADEELFPYCTDFAPTPDAALQAEARRILDEVTLSADERAALTKRLPALRGQEPGGG